MPSIPVRFLLIGPAIGSIVFIIVSGFTYSHVSTTAVSTIPEHIGIGTQVLNAIAVWSFGCLIAYPMAGIPAAICGVIYWFILRQHTSGNFKWPLRVLIGGVVGFICASAFVGILFASSYRGDVLTLFLNWGVSGTASGALCALSISQNIYDRVFPGGTQFDAA